MTPVYLYNSLQREKQQFIPIKAGEIRLYVCGMTVYDYCHIGHARAMTAFDLMVRFLRSQGWRVTYIRNITDIDDKILKRSQEADIPYRQLTQQFTQAMWEDFGSLRVLTPDQEPKATQHIEQIIAMVDTLIAQDYAYQASNGDIYFSVSQFPTYGNLSGKQIQELLSGARVVVEESKRDPRDFALWKAAGPEQVGWDSPWGRGRPGWHIECSAMSKTCLGDHFDIHGGGTDLIFPHHENEIAQSEAANGCPFVNYWLHVAPVRLDGEKMSKSLGNVFTIRDLLKQYHPEVLRHFLISSHYRSPISYSELNLKEAKNGIDRFYYCLRDYPDAKPLPLKQIKDSPYYLSFIEAMNDDFNTREALAVMYDMVRTINQSNKEQSQQLASELRTMGNLLGILETDAADYLQLIDQAGISSSTIEALIEERLQAKKANDYQRADAIRELLIEQGIQIEDKKGGGTRWRRL